MARRTDEVLDRMVETVVELFRQGNVCPDQADIARAVWSGGPVTAGMQKDVRDRLAKLRGLLEAQGYDVVPFSAVFTSTYRGKPAVELEHKQPGVVATRDLTEDEVDAIREINARRCTPIGQGKQEIGLMLVDDREPRSLDIWCAWHQIGRNQGAAKVRRSNVRIGRALTNGTLPTDRALGIRETSKSIEGDDLFGQLTAS